MQQRFEILNIRMKPVSRFGKSALLLFLMLYFPMLPGTGNEAFGQLWTGDVDESWHEAGNWDGGTVPGPDATVSIRPQDGNPFPVITQDVTVDKIILSEWTQGGELTVTGGATLTVDHQLDINNNGWLFLDNGTLQFNGDGSGQQNINMEYTNTLIDISNGGTLIAGSAGLQMNGSFVMDDGYLSLADGLDVSDNKTFQVVTGTVDVSGQSNINGTVDGGFGEFTFDGDSKDGANIRSGGRFYMAPTNPSNHPHSCSTPVANPGSVEFIIEAQVENNGHMYGGDASITFHQEANFQGDAVTEIHNGELVFMSDADFSNTSTLSITCDGSVQIDGDGTFQQNGNMNVGDGTLNVAGNATFENSGTLNGGDGDITFESDVTIANNGGVINADNSTMTFQGETFDNSGTFDPGTSTFNFDGDGSQTITGTNTDIEFYNLEVNNDSDVTAEQNVTVLNDMEVDDVSDYNQQEGTNLNVIGEVTGEPEIITDRPYIVYIEILGPASVEVKFDQNNQLDPQTSQVESNYEVSDQMESINKIADVSSATLTDAHTVTLEFDFSNYSGSGLEEGEYYYLYVNNVENDLGDPVNTNHRKRFGGEGAFPVLTYYSLASGDWQNAGTWTLENTHSGPAASTAPSPGSEVVIAAGHTVTLQDDVENNESITVGQTGTLVLGSRIIEGDGSFVLASGGTLQIGSSDGIAASGSSGNIRTASRSFSSGAGYVYNGTTAQSTGNGLPATVNNLTINNSNGVSAVSNLEVTGTLSLSAGEFTIPSGKNLIADNKSIGGGSLRFLRQLNGSKGWRLMSAPVGTNFSDFVTGPTGGLVTQGFSGADLPDEMPNILHFAEDTPSSPDDTVTTNMNWRSISSTGSSVIPGRGYLVYVFDGADGPGDVQARNDDLPLTLSAGGQENEPSGSEFDFNVTHTARQIYTEDEGWNLVGNPFGATIDWDQNGWTKTDIHETIYVWDPNANSGNGAYLEWNGVSGALGSGKIAPFQAFWVKAEDPGAGLAVSRDALTTGDTFRGKAIASGRFDEVLLKLHHNNTGYEKESRLMFSGEGKSAEDSYDAYRLMPLSDTYLSLFTVREEDHNQLAINSLPDHADESISIPLEAYGVRDGKALEGRAKLEWNEPAGMLQELSLYLVDRHTGERINMRNRLQYEFDLSSSNSDYFQQTASAGSVGSGTIKAGHEDMAVSARNRMEDEEPVITMNQPGGVFKLKQQSTDAEARFRIEITKRIQAKHSDQIPDRIRLHQNYPNPFNSGTTLRFALPEDTRVRLTVYDALGREVAVPADAEFTQGHHELHWDVEALPSGTYIYRLEAEGITRTRKMTLIK